MSKTILQRSFLRDLVAFAFCTHCVIEYGSSDARSHRPLVFVISIPLQQMSGYVARWFTRNLLCKA